MTDLRIVLSPISIYRYHVRFIHTPRGIEMEWETMGIMAFKTYHMTRYE